MAKATSSVEDKNLAQSQTQKDLSDDELFGVESEFHKSGDASPAASIYDEGIIAASETSSKPQALKEYSFHTTATLRNFRLMPTSAKGQSPKYAAVYYAEHSLLTPGKPDITLHRGPEKDTPILGVCKISRGFGTYIMGLGDPKAAEDKMIWEDLKRHGIFGSRHWDFSMNIPSQPTRRSFTWKRTHAENKMSLLNRKLIDDKTGKVVALFLRNKTKSLKKMGKVTFFEDLGEEWEIMVLLTLLTMIEKVRRSRRTAGGGGGGGGS